MRKCPYQTERSLPNKKKTMDQPLVCFAFCFWAAACRFRKKTPPPLDLGDHSAAVWTAVFLGVQAAQRQRIGAGRRGGTRSAMAGPVPVTVATATKGSIGVYLDAIGTVTPVYTDNVTAQVTGVITAVHYREGQTVHKGDPLIDIDSRPYAGATRSGAGRAGARPESAFRSADGPEALSGRVGQECHSPADARRPGKAGAPGPGNRARTIRAPSNTTRCRWHSATSHRRSTAASDFALSIPATW